MRLGPMELVIILVIVLLIFGVGKLPQVGEALGKGLKSFQKASSGEDEEEKKEEVKAEKSAEEPKAEVIETKPAAEDPKPESSEKA
ncbi:MAG: twin-arginine translocase TatA/TatE family subunit [Dehalogenimonas sp.]